MTSENFIRQELGSVPHVTRVEIWSSDECREVVTTVDDFSSASRELVYEAELRVVDRFPNERFSFLCVPGGAEPETTTTTDSENTKTSI